MTDAAKGRRSFAIRQIRGGEERMRQDPVAVEAPIDLYLDDQLLRRFYASPDDLSSLALGHLYIEGRMAGLDDLEELRLEDGAVHVRLKAGAGRQPAQAPPAVHISADQLWAHVAEMEAGMQLFKETGGVHGGALWDSTGELVAEAWDVARHNVVDKLCGQLLQKGRSPRGLVMTFSGRQAAAIVEKALAMELSLLAGISAASSLGIELAERGGLALVGFVRPGRMNIYCHGEGIRWESEKKTSGPLVLTVTAARSGSGKTTFIQALLRALPDLRIGVLKSSSHPYDMDPRKDTGIFYSAGADLVLYHGPGELHVHQREAEGDLLALAQNQDPDLDLTLIESRGERRGLVLEIVRGPEALAAYQNRPQADFVVSDLREDFGQAKLLPLNDPQETADLIRSLLAESRRT